MSTVRPSPLHLLHHLLHVALFLALFWPFAAGQEVKVFSFQRGIWGAPSDQVFARYNFSRNAPPVTQLSVCYRLRFEAFSKGFEVHVSYKASDDNLDPFYFGNTGRYFDTWFANQEQSGAPLWDVYPEVWHHVCHTFAKDTYTLYWEGQVRVANETQIKTVQTVFSRILARGWPCPLNGTLVLGQEQDNLGGGFDKHQIFRGDMTQVSLWGRVLAPAQVEALSACRDVGRGDLFASDTFQLEEVGVKVSQLSLSSLCQNSQHNVVFPEERPLEDAHHLCRRLNASLAVPASADDNQRLAEQLQTFRDVCVPTADWKLWLGITDEREDGIWLQFHNNEAVSYHNFPPLNAGSSYTCAAMKLDGFWDGDRCSSKRCAACRVARTSFLYLRGLCFDSRFRMRFRVDGYMHGRPYFRGYYDHVILWDEEHRQWLLVDTTTNATLLAAEDVPEGGYPVGKHSWAARRGVCGQGRGAVLLLSLAPCEDHHFTCDTGDCIPGDLRCDFRYDCTDGSDEVECGVVEFKDHLQKELPPTGPNGGPLTVAPSLTLSRIADVDDIAMAVTLEFHLTLHWTDTRLRLRHLRTCRNGTILTEGDAQRVWQPRYSLTNLEGGTQQRLGHSLLVTGSNGAALPEYNSVDMDLVYPGADNSMSLRQRYMARVTCYFELYGYPFDIQLCSIDLELPSELDDYVELVVEDEDTASYTGPHELSKYTVEAIRFSKSSGGRRVSLEFELHRRQGIVVFSNFLPSAMLLVVSWSTLFIRIEAINVRCIMSLTTLLVLYTLFANMSQSLPSTAAIKLIDIWFFFIIFVLFINIMIHVFVDDKSPPPPPPPAPPSPPHSPSHPPSSSPKPVQLFTKVAAIKVDPVPTESPSLRFLRRYRTVYLPVVVLIFNIYFWVAVFLSRK